MPNYPENWPQSTYVAAVQQVSTVPLGGAAITVPDVPYGTVCVVTLTANAVLTFPKAVTGKSFYLALVQGGAGSFTVTWPANVKFSGGTAPTLTLTAGKTDLVEFLSLDGVSWYVTGAPILNM